MRLIDADTIDDVVQDLNENHNSGITRNEYKRITAVLYEMPTIDAVPVKHGYWLPYEFCTDGTWDKCSVCGVAHRTRSKYTGYIDGKEYTIQDRMNYCPNCGAKMDGGKDDGT